MDALHLLQQILFIVAPVAILGTYFLIQHRVDELISRARRVRPFSVPEDLGEHCGSRAVYECAAQYVEIANSRAALCLWAMVRDSVRSRGCWHMLRRKTREETYDTAMALWQISDCGELERALARDLSHLRRIILREQRVRYALAKGETT